jgi:hypothetical protein
MLNSSTPTRMAGGEAPLTNFENKSRKRIVEARTAR